MYDKLLLLWHQLNRTLGKKILGILIIFFLIALAAIAITLFVSWQLKGASAAINDAGSLRMRTQQIGYHVARGDRALGDPQQFADTLRNYVRQFDTTLTTLIEGDRNRPLFIPRDRGIPEGFAALQALWMEELRPELLALADRPEPAVLRAVDDSFHVRGASFVEAINTLVGEMEISYEHSTNVLQATQIMLVLLAVIGTLALIRFFDVQVVKPVGQLSEGIRRMEAEDFDARVTVENDDELGRLAAGFNQAAAHLQDLYSTLEARVQSKTRSLTAKNRELEILYAISGFLNEPNDVDTLCNGFLQRVQERLGAHASAIRLFDSRSENLCMTYYQGLSGSFVDEEALLGCGECLCGEAVSQRNAVIVPIEQLTARHPLEACRRAGFSVISASPITVGKKPIGMFNLFFSTAQPLDPSDHILLETLGEQLGAAIDNLRLQARERELAVSEERNLLARELHDSIAQGLAFTNLQIQMLEAALKRQDSAVLESSIKLIRQGVQESYDDLRELMVHFRTRVGQLDLDAAITAALKRLAEQTDITTHLDVRGGGAPLDPETETQLLYIVQEALSNIRKHAQARLVEVQLHRNPDGLTVVIKDDGVGFDHTAEAIDQQAHIGLEIMRERALRIGARVEVRSERGKGTEIKLNLPRDIEVTA